MKATDWWASGAGIADLTPRGATWPEGIGFADDLHALARSGHVLELGCGAGRLAGFFRPSAYVGVDVCAAALDRAARSHPNHVFALVDTQTALPSADVTLAHTVLLHVPDEDLPGLIGRIRSPRVVVSEILGRHWRRTGNPPVFNREADDYAAAFAAAGFAEHARWTRHYNRYGGVDLSLMEFRWTPTPPTSSR
jgi:SAM-dependent methyltransferase